jgi:hypothetical protein
MPPAAKFVNCVYTVKITKELKLLGVSLIVIFPRAVRETAHNNACDICHEKVADSVVQGDSFGTRLKKMRISKRLFIIQFNIL